MINMHFYREIWHQMSGKIFPNFIFLKLNKYVNVSTVGRHEPCPGLDSYVFKLWYIERMNMKTLFRMFICRVGWGICSGVNSRGVIFHEILVINVQWLLLHIKGWFSFKRSQYHGLQSYSKSKLRMSAGGEQGEGAFVGYYWVLFKSRSCDLYRGKNCSGLQM